MFFARHGEWRGERGLLWINILAALIYLLCVQVSYQFINLDPSDRVAPLWLPSAFSLSLFFFFERRILLGIIGGSILGAVAVLSNGSPPLAPAVFLLLAVVFSLADVIQPILANAWIKKFYLNNAIPSSLSPENPFIRVKTTLTFIQAAVITPLSSATLGAGVLAMTGILPREKILLSFITWWLANALANLVFSPVPILWRFSSWSQVRQKKLEFTLLILALAIISVLTFIKNYPIAYLYLPLVLLSVFIFGGIIASLIVALVTIISLVATAQGYGIFVQVFQTNHLIFLQSFTGILSLTALICSAANQEREAAQKALRKMIESLEDQVACQTCELESARRRLEIANQELEKLANTDGLTKIANRRCFDQMLEREWYRLLRERQPLSLLMLDVDYFKAYNDFYGHPQGDVCLTQIAQVLTQIPHRHCDFVARYGGEEFVVLLPNTDLAGAVVIAKNLQKTLAELSLPHGASPLQPNLTVSIGIASLIPRSPYGPQDLLKKADQALYGAWWGDKSG